MLKPNLEDFDNGDGTIDYDAYIDILGDYEDIAYDEMRDREIEERSENEEKI